MVNKIYNTVNDLVLYFEEIGKDTCPWEKENINVAALKNLFNNHQRLILEQTENKETAQKLQQSIWNLSDKITKEIKTPEANVLAFEIMGMAIGLFDSNKPDWSQLPIGDLKHKIFGEILPKDDKPKSGLAPSIFVKKDMDGWGEHAQNVRDQWVNDHNISIKEYGCKTAKDAVECIIQRKLISANLIDFPDLDDADLEKIEQNCPFLERLFIKSHEISEDKLAHALKSLVNLTSLNLSGCNQITGDKLADALKSLVNLTSLNLSFCNQITGDTLAEALTSLVNLTSLNLTCCT